MRLGKSRLVYRAMLRSPENRTIHQHAPTLAGKKAVANTGSRVAINELESIPFPLDGGHHKTVGQTMKSAAHVKCVLKVRT